MNKNFENWKKKNVDSVSKNEDICDILSQKLIDEIKKFEYLIREEEYWFSLNLSDKDFKNNIREILYSLR